MYLDMYLSSSHHHYHHDPGHSRSTCPPAPSRYTQVQRLDKTLVAVEARSLAQLEEASERVSEQVEALQRVSGVGGVRRKLLGFTPSPHSSHFHLPPSPSLPFASPVSLTHSLRNPRASWSSARRTCPRSRRTSRRGSI